MPQDNSLYLPFSDSADQDLFFKIPREFFKSTKEFQALLTDLEKAKSLDLPETEIENSTPFKDRLAGIREAYKTSQQTAALTRQKEAILVEKQQLTTDVLDGKQAYFELSLEDQEWVFEESTEIAFNEAHELHKKAGMFLARLQRQALMIGMNNQRELITAANKNARANEAILGVQQAILETQQGMEATLTDAMSAIKSTQVSLEIQQIVIRNQVAIDAEIEERHKSHGHVKRLRRGTQLRVKISQEVQNEAVEMAGLVYTREMKNFSFEELRSYKLNQALSNPEAALRSYRTDLR